MFLFLSKLFLKICLVTLIIFIGLNLWVILSANHRIFKDAVSLPRNEVGLVLGTSYRLANGRINLFCQARLKAAAFLYKKGKVKYLLLSGDNHIKGYDEPAQMREALLKLGIPSAVIFMDKAGFRTLDSVVRAKKVFGQQKFTIITDDFHAHRSVFLSQHHGMDTVAFCSKEIPFKWSAKARYREYLARVRAVFDTYLLHTQPKYLGNQILIP